MTSKPHIFIVPGFWEVPEAFDTVREKLHKADLKTTLAPLESTGHTNSKADADAGRARYTMTRDIAEIRKVLESLVVDQGLDVIAVGHSAGGFLGSAAMEGLSRKARGAMNLPGGVKKIVFLTAGVLPEREWVPQFPITNIEGDELVCADPRKIAFNDFTDEAEIQRCMKLFKCAPAFGWVDAPIPYCGWKEVPSVYLVCERDAAIPQEAQTMMANRAGSEVIKCNAGHMVQLSQPDIVANLIIKVASE